MDDVIKLESGHRIEIWHDQDCDSPRDGENLGTFQIYHRRYASPDKIVREPPHINKDEIGLKVWGYDHSGVVYATGETNPFSCPWDSGFAGIIFCSKQKAREWLGVKRLTKSKIAQIAQILNDEVKIYNEWSSGEVYGFTVYDPEDNVIDSCGGFYGSDREYMLKEAQECLTTSN